MSSTAQDTSVEHTFEIAWEHNKHEYTEAVTAFDRKWFSPCPSSLQVSFITVCFLFAIKYKGEFSPFLAKVI
jgi:hypothetical protein